MHKCGWGPPNCPGEHRQKWWRFPSPGHAAEREDEGNNTANKPPLFQNSLPPPPFPAKRITNGEQGQNKTWKNYFCPKAVNAAVLPAPRRPLRALPGAARLLAAAGTRGVALTSGVVTAGSSGQARPLPGKWDFEMLESPERTEGRAPCLSLVFFKGTKHPSPFCELE